MRDRPRKSAAHSKKVRAIEPHRIASVAMDRIRTLLARTNRGEKMGEGASMRELVARGNVLGRGLPPSYSAALKVGDWIGEPEELFDAEQMRQQLAQCARTKPALDVARYVPFGRSEDGLLCFDLQSLNERDSELGVALWDGMSIRTRWRNFAEWLDSIADRRDEEADRAARIPAGLKRLLSALGFSFDDPIVGRLETADVEAIRALIGS